MIQTKQQLRGKLLLGALVLSAYCIAPTNVFAAEFFASTTNGVYANTKQLIISAYTNQYNPFNAAAAVIQYNPEEIYPVYATTSNSIFPYFTIPPTIDRVNHTISFAGGTPALGGFIFTGRLFSIEYIPLKEGTDSIFRFSEGEILAHDGVGTNLYTP